MSDSCCSMESFYPSQPTEQALHSLGAICGSKGSNPTSSSPAYWVVPELQFWTASTIWNKFCPSQEMWTRPNIRKKGLIFIVGRPDIGWLISTCNCLNERKNYTSENKKCSLGCIKVDEHIWFPKIISRYWIMPTWALAGIGSLHDELCGSEGLRYSCISGYPYRITHELHSVCVP